MTLGELRGPQLVGAASGAALAGATASVGSETP
jgi:hypothetical protein